MRVRTIDTRLDGSERVTLALCDPCDEFIDDDPCADHILANQVTEEYEHFCSMSSDCECPLPHTPL